MSEILIHDDYNGGFFCRSHYSPCAPFGVGRNVDSAVKDWIKKDLGRSRSAKRNVSLHGYSLLLMDERSKEDFGKEIEDADIKRWEDWANSLSTKEFNTLGRCPHCGMFPFTPYQS